MGVSTKNNHKNNSWLFEDERTAVLINGTYLFTLARNLGFDVDYSLFREMFVEQSQLVTMNYYTSILETDDYTPIKPLVDWLSYNGYTVTSKRAAETVDKNTGQRKVSGSVLAEMITDMLLLASSKKMDHIVIFSGDPDLRYPIEMAKRLHAVRITVVGAQNTPPWMPDIIRRQVDRFVELSELKEDIMRRLVTPRMSNGTTPEFMTSRHFNDSSFEPV